MLGLPLALLSALVLQQSPTPKTHVLVVVGISGDSEAVNFDREFYSAGRRVVDVARQVYGIPDSAIIFLAEHPERDTRRIQGPSTKAEVEQAFAKIAKRSAPDDIVLVVLIGHGSEHEPARFNMPGRDLTAADFAKLLTPLAKQKVVFVNGASASVGFIPVLSGKNRVIMTASKTARERYFMRFPGYFGVALGDEKADKDKDGRISLLEAFEYARTSVAQAYAKDRALLYEHALLDDDGDGQGAETPGSKAASPSDSTSAPPSSDGAFAATLFLTGPRTLSVGVLYRQKGSIEARVDDLGSRKATMDAAVYRRDLEKLLLDLVIVNEKIRQVDGEQTSAGRAS